MKRLITIMIAVMVLYGVHAQPGGSETPYTVDNTFTATMDFLQMTWKGEYVGIDPDSRSVLKLSRELVLNKDLSFVNVVHVFVSETETVIMRKEIGTYNCNEGKIEYTITEGTILDMKSFFQGTELLYSNAVDYVEALQFTKENAQGKRSWILFDERLKSQVDPNRTAVYLLTSEETSDGIESVHQEQEGRKVTHYRINGMRCSQNDKGIQIVNGKKILVK